MKKLIGLIFLSGLIVTAPAQKKTKLLTGMYLQWGYNTEWYTKSTIHFNTEVNGVPHNFTIYKAKAHDRSDMGAIAKYHNTITALVFILIKNIPGPLKLITTTLNI